MEEGGFDHFHTCTLTSAGSASPVRQTPSSHTARSSPPLVLTAWNPPAPHPFFPFNPKAFPMLPAPPAQSCLDGALQHPPSLTPTLQPPAVPKCAQRHPEGNSN